MRAGSNVKFWHNLVSYYSGLQLSEPSDRLPAIAGLARELHEIGQVITKPIYHAGLWRDSLVQDLLWRVDEPLCSRPERRSDNPSPPTWSWASVEDKISYWPEVLVDQGFSILGVETNPAPYTDSFGECTGGKIKVTCSVVPATLNGIASALGDDRRPGQPRYCVDVSCMKVPMFADYLLPSTGEYHPSGKKVFCSGQFRGKLFTVSLVLQQVQGSAVYQRIGIVQIPHNNFKAVPVSVDVRNMESDIGAHRLAITII